MTNQEAFDIVVRGLRQQGRKSLFTKDQMEKFGHLVSSSCDPCAYRGEGGCKCAFGFLIPDDLYDPGMENKIASLVLDNWPAVKANVDGVSEDLIARLQRIHDRYDVSEWEEEWRLVAIHFNLTIPT